MVVGLIAICQIWSGSLAADKRLTYIVGAGQRPALASEKDGTLDAVYEAREPGKNTGAICYSRSTDQGKSWTEPNEISKTPGLSLNPAIASNGNGMLAAVWSGTNPRLNNPDIFLSHSTDRGKTWSEPIDISNTEGASLDPRIVFSDDNFMHIVWSDTKEGQLNPDIYYTSIDCGKSWNKISSITNISNTPGSSIEPSIAAAKNVLHVAWVDASPGVHRPDIYYAKNLRGVWLKALDLSNSIRTSTHPAVTCGKGKVFICWSDNSRKENAADIWCDVGGGNAKFAKPINISSSPGVSSQPAVTADESGHVAIVWSDTTPGPETPHIFARISADSCDDFSNVLDLSEIDGASVHPDVAINHGRVFVIWENVEAANNFQRHTLKVTSVEIGGIATGPATMVDPTLHTQTGNMH